MIVLMSHCIYDAKVKSCFIRSLRKNLRACLCLWHVELLVDIRLPPPSIGVRQPLLTNAAATFCVVKSAFQSCVPLQAPNVHLALQCLIQHILFVTYRIGICGTHSLHIVCIKSLQDVQYEMLCASNKC